MPAIFTVNPDGGGNKVKLATIDELVDIVKEQVPVPVHTEAEPDPVQPVNTYPEFGVAVHAPIEVPVV